MHPTRSIIFALLCLPWVLGQGIKTAEQAAHAAGAQVTWFRHDPRLLEEGRNRAEVAKSDAESRDFDRSAAMDEAIKEAATQGKLVLWYVPRILKSSFPSQGAQMYRPAILDGYVKATFFTDPDLVDLINHRFVPARIIVDRALGERFAIEAPDSVEPVFVILNGKGDVLHKIDRIRTFNSSWFYRVLLESLKSDTSMPPSLTPEETSSAATRARALRRRGHDVPPSLLAEAASEAEKASIQLETVRSYRLRAQFDEAKAAHSEALAAAAQMDDARARDLVVAHLHCELGRILLLQGDLTGAVTEFRKVRRGPTAEAQFHLGLCAYFQSNDTFAMRHFKEAVIADPESPWATKAAVNLVDGTDRTPIGPTVHGYEDPFFTAAPVVNPRNSGRPREARDSESIARASLQYLLRMQRENGGWTDSRYAYWPTPDITPNVWIAATALSCAALLDWRELDPVAVDAALSKGESYLFDERYMARGFQEEVYSESYKLFYLARKFDHSKEANTQAACVDRMNGVVERIKQLQGDADSRAPGFWGHEYPNPFTTAAVMNALVHAKNRGARVPTVLLTRGADAMLTVRSDVGAFAYGAGRKPRGNEETQRKDSSGRSAICEAAILWSGHESGEAARVENALKDFWTFLPRLERIRLCDFHTDGELGGFFFWHAIFHTVESFDALPVAQRGAHKARMLEFMTKLGEQDGSFLDSHEIGKSYGTAMSLLVLKRLLETGP
jgi:tetratricopeptide (TPR) repeat protein